MIIMIYNENENKFALMENQANNNEKPKYVGITAADENSIFVWSSFGANSFCEIPETTDDMITVITNAKNPYITIYNVKNLCQEDLRRVIDKHCAFLSQGCSFRYKLVNRVGNCYFVN